MNKREQFVWKLGKLVATARNDRGFVFEEEHALLDAFEAGNHYFPQDREMFWGPHMLIWDARLAHYQTHEEFYKNSGVVICRTTDRYSYHACEVMDVYITDLQGNKLYHAKPVYGEKSAWDSAHEWMIAHGYTHNLHYGGYPPVNSGRSPYGWLDIKSVNGAEVALNTPYSEV